MKRRTKGSSKHFLTDPNGSRITATNRNFLLALVRGLEKA